MLSSSLYILFDGSSIPRPLNPNWKKKKKKRRRRCSFYLSLFSIF